ncbi:hypothetical protein [Atlantibacter subterraneus]|uniref:hypothetical protein n=1 Tax=Atlantibacter subterraneus TaxID=255519 RepID=UPI002FDD1505
MTTPTIAAQAAPTISSPIPLSTPSEQALFYFTAILNRDHATLIRDFKWTLEECQALDVEQQNHAANKLLAAGNVLNRKTPQPAPAQPAPPATMTPTQRPTFQPFAGSGSQFAPKSAA